jgi:hypothetical protein
MKSETKLAIYVFVVFFFVWRLLYYNEDVTGNIFLWFFKLN